MRTEKDIIEIFKHCTFNVDVARDKYDLILKPCGSGVFRRVYKIKGFPLVVKFCRDVPYAKDHAANEYNIVNTLLTGSSILYNVFNKHIPDIYTIGSNGTILMKEYKRLKYPKRHKQYKELSNLIRKHFNNEYDLDENQFGVDNDNNLVILDWGFIGADETYKWWNEEGYLG